MLYDKPLKTVGKIVKVAAYDMKSTRVLRRLFVDFVSIFGLHLWT